MDVIDTIELIIDENSEFSGVEAISLVESPAIEEDFVALKSHKVEFKTIDEEKRIVIGLALIPDKLIYRRDGDREYNIFFSKKTVRDIAYKWIEDNNNNNATLEHQLTVNGVTFVETWIVEDPETDKTKLYGLNAVEGAWAVIGKIKNDEVWADVKAKKYKGLSIEGYFIDKLDRPNESVEEELSEAEYDEFNALADLQEILEALSEEELAKTYSDYPQAARNNAKRALKWAEENGWGGCGTPVGKQRANQLANGEPLSASTIARMASFKRHQKNKDVPYSEGCGGLMWDAWGGSAGVNWAISKMKELNG